MTTREEKSKRGNKATSICRQTGDHVHYPPTRISRSKRPLHAPSPNLCTRFASNFRVTRYGECRKNQAADIGTTAYDGCGEFVTATTGEDPTNCAACGCHRSFHLEESHPEIRTTNGHVSATVLEMLNISSFQFRQIFCTPYGGRNGEDKDETTGSGDGNFSGEEEEEEEEDAERVKRLKTKFTAEQKEKMRSYAEKLRWKLRQENHHEAEEFCSEIGVNQKNFRIWMNNHKDKN